MELSIQSISDPKRLSNFQEPLDAFVAEKNKNPYISSILFKQRMESNRSKDSIPTFVVLTTQEKIIGVAPLLIKKYRGIRSAKFLLNYWRAPLFQYFRG
jgi:hypothetical protein